MSDMVLTIRQAEDFFQNLTLQLLDLDPAAKESQSRVRIAWPDNGAPAWKRNEDVAFLLLNYDDDLITRQMDVTYQQLDVDNADMIMSYTRVLRVDWVCYGPNSFDDMDKIRSGLYKPNITELLGSNNLSLILDTTMPMRSPELYNGQWWDRTSFYARFNEKVVRSAEIPYIKIADVQIVKG